MTKDDKTTRANATRKCPVCGHEAWRVMYGMIMPDTREQFPKAEFAGCGMMEELRVYPATGKVEMGVPKWACQNPECRHRWW
ncbi:hypothetical protein [Arthrobacter sp. B1I2]|uniref:hypothetical protein n=1 Tax=Arthrobacter sp. B1I2 TaxID=3042263 RepID=UPI00277F74F5|nr:hypothetical protein [Arthrobacter sp. B1I2]MDQ0733112.1 hypothetical protein [Arthrobacter sp. B1I2]